VGGAFKAFDGLLLAECAVFDLTEHRIELI
jgi:hypothetical protein